MAAYVKQGDQIVLILSKAEGVALRDLATYAEAAIAEESTNPSTNAARDRAVRAICVACEPGSRSGATVTVVAPVVPVRLVWKQPASARHRPAVVSSFTIKGLNTENLVTRTGSSGRVP